jgi:tetratricopeptide (TPR) repeat protein
MESFVFFEPKPEALRKLGLPPLPFPVRLERRGAIFPQSGDVDFAGALDELNVFLAVSPQHRKAYRPFVAALCYLVGVDASAQGYHEAAAHYFRTGLAADPASAALRSNYGLSQLCLGREPDECREFELVVASTPKDRILPVTWMLLARIYARDGLYEKAYRLLKEVGALIPDEPGFWDFLGEMQEKAGLDGPPMDGLLSGDEDIPEKGAGSDAHLSACSAEAPAAAANETSAVSREPTKVRRFCSSCGTPVNPDWRFCQACGGKLP